MFDEKIILTRLQNGEDAQTIANEMAAMINTANKMYADQKAAEEAAKAKAAEAVVSQKKEDLQEILDMLSAWLGEYYDFEETLPADQVIEIIDSLKEYMEAIKGLESVFKVKRPAAPIGTKVIKSNTKPANADETINQFLKNMGW